MPPAPKHNWNYLYDVYQKLCETEPDTGVSGFARSHGADEGACRAAFNRLRKKRSMRTIRTKTGRTDGRAKSEVFDDVSPAEAREIVQQISDPRLVGCHAKVLTVLFRSLDRIDYVHQKQCEKNEDGTDKIKIETIRDIKDEYISQKELIYVLRDLMPFISELADRVGIENVINKLQGKAIDVTQAALEISKIGANLPEALKIMLSKTPPILIAQNFETPPDTDEMDQRALETLKLVQWQYECFLPQRRQEVIELKKEMKGVETFAPTKETI